MCLRPPCFLCVCVGVQNSLGGNAMTALVVTVAGEGAYAHESVSTLQFGSRAKLISVKAKVNEVVDYRALYEAAQSRLDAGDDESTRLGIEVQSLEAQLAAAQRQCEASARECSDLRAELEVSKSFMTSQLAMFDGLRLGEVDGVLGGASVSKVVKQAVESVHTQWKAELEKVKRIHSEDLAVCQRKMEAEVCVCASPLVPLLPLHACGCAGGQVAGQAQRGVCEGDTGRVRTGLQ